MTKKKTIAPGLNKAEINPSLNRSNVDLVFDILPIVTSFVLLKKFTAIPEKFINEYSKFYDMCNNNTFGIKITDIMEYFKITNLTSEVLHLRKSKFSKFKTI